MSHSTPNISPGAETLDYFAAFAAHFDFAQCRL